MPPRQLRFRHRLVMRSPEEHHVQAPDLNPQEGIWSLVEQDIGNLAAAGLGQLTRAVKRKLEQIQYRPHLVDGRLTGIDPIMDG